MCKLEEQAVPRYLRAVVPWTVFGRITDGVCVVGKFFISFVRWLSDAFRVKSIGRRRLYTVITTPYVLHRFRQENVDKRWYYRVRLTIGVCLSLTFEIVWGVVINWVFFRSRTPFVASMVPFVYQRSP